MARKTPMILATGLAIGIGATIGPTPTRGQMAMSGSGRPLGGYGAGTISSYYGNGGGYLPDNGRGAGLLPTGGAGALAASPPPRMTPRTPIGGASMVAETPIGGISAGGMGMGMASGPRGGMRIGPRSGRRAYAPLLPGGALSGMTRAGGMSPGRSPAGPGLGYPFRMPLEFGGGSQPMGMP